MTVQTPTTLVHVTELSSMTLSAVSLYPLLGALAAAL